MGRNGINMNGFVVLAACVCAASAQGLVGGYAGAFNPAPSSQFHAQDELGQFSFGHAGGPSARTEARNAYGVTPAPTNTLTPMVFSKLSTTLLIPLMDSELPEPPFQLPLLTLLRLLLPRLNLLLLTLLLLLLPPLPLRSLLLMRLLKLLPLLPSLLSFHTHMLVPMVSVLVFSVVFTPLLPVPLLLTLLTLPLLLLPHLLMLVLVPHLLMLVPLLLLMLALLPLLMLLPLLLLLLPVRLSSPPSSRTPATPSLIVWIKFSSQTLLYILPHKPYPASQVELRKPALTGFPTSPSHPQPK